MAWYWIVLSVLAALWLITVAMYWLNLDNKLVYYVVRPMMKKKYGSQKRDIRL